MNESHKLRRLHVTAQRQAVISGFVQFVQHAWAGIPTPKGLLFTFTSIFEVEATSNFKKFMVEIEKKPSQFDIVVTIRKKGGLWKPISVHSACTGDPVISGSNGVLNYIHPQAYYNYVYVKTKGSLQKNLANILIGEEDKKLRRPNATGILIRIITGLPEDIRLVEHDDGTRSLYSIDELDIESPRWRVPKNNR